MAILTFWLNAFIPQTVTGYTSVLTAGPHAGKTAIPLPGVARSWPGNWNKDWDCGYLTDQRGFDNNPSASRRMQSLVDIELTTMSIVRQAHTSSGTTEVNLVTGVQTGFAIANMSRCSFTAMPGTGAVVTRTVPLGVPLVAPTASTAARWRLSAAAGDPLVGMAADIDYNGTLSITPRPGGVFAVAFEGLIDAFPAYDCYARLNGMTKTVFTDSPPAGNTVADLLGPANRPKSGSVMFP